MAINPSIALGVRPMRIEQQDPNAGMNALARMMQLNSAMQEADTYRRGQEEENALRGLYRDPSFSWNDPTKRSAAFAASPTKAPAHYKAFVDSEKDRFALAEKGYNLFRQNVGSHINNPNATKQDVLASLEDQVAVGMMDPTIAQKLAATLPDDPTLLRGRIRQIVMAQMKPDEMLTIFAPKPKQIDNGQQISFVDENPNSPTYGKPTGPAPVQKVMTPGEVAADSRARENTRLRREELDLSKKREQREAGQDATGGGSVLGVPAPAVLPWSNQSNPKDANKVKATEISRGAKEIEKDSDAARKEAVTAQQAKRFLELNEKTPTGGLVDKVALGRWANSFGSDYAEMEAITARLAPAMREPGSGSTSDFDGKQFERATVGVDKPKKANENIAKGIIARSQQAQEYAEFRQTYLEQNGTLQGADRFWKDYVNANPIFDPNKPGTYELNAKRKTWTEHFKGKTASPAGSNGQQRAPAGGQGGGLTPEERAELEALRKQLGGRQ